MTKRDRRYGTPEARAAADAARHQRLIDSGGRPVSIRLTAARIAKLDAAAAALGIKRGGLAAQILIDAIDKLPDSPAE